MSEGIGRDDQVAEEDKDFNVDAEIAAFALPVDAWKKESADGEVYILSHDGEDFYLIAPTRVKFKRFVDGAMKSSFDSMVLLLMDCLKSPLPEEFQARIERQPQLVSILANAFVSALNIDTAASVKKA